MSILLRLAALALFGLFLRHGGEIGAVYGSDDGDLITGDDFAGQGRPVRDVGESERVWSVCPEGTRRAQVPEPFEDVAAVIRDDDLGAWRPEALVPLAPGFAILVPAVVSNGETYDFAASLPDAVEKFARLFAASAT
jgi:hypothetical protein